MHQRMSTQWCTSPPQGLMHHNQAPFITVGRVSVNMSVPLVEDVQVGKVTLGIQYDTGCQLSLISKSALSKLPPSMYSVLPYRNRAQPTGNSTISEQPDPELHGVWLYPLQHHHLGGAPHLLLQSNQEENQAIKKENRRRSRNFWKKSGGEPENPGEEPEYQEKKQEENQILQEETRRKTRYPHSSKTSDQPQPSNSVRKPRNP